MGTRSWLLAAAGALALPLLAGSAFAQGAGTGTVGSDLGSTYRMEHKGEGGEHTPRHFRHKMGMTKKATSAPHAQAPKMAQVPSGATSTEQLNEMSLSAAKQGQSFAPAPSSAPAAKKSM